MKNTHVFYVLINFCPCLKYVHLFFYLLIFLCRYEKRREIDRRKDYPEERVNNQPQQTFNRPRAADHWQDPWQRYL